MKKYLYGAALLALCGCGYTQTKDGSSTPGTITSTGAPTGGTTASGSNPAPTTSTSPAPTVTFTQVSQQILQAKCLSCHSGGQAPNLSSYAGFATNTSYVVPGDPAQSRLYTAVQSGAMPQGGPALSQAEVSLIYDWIEQGAQNN